MADRDRHFRDRLLRPADARMAMTRILYMSDLHLEMESFRLAVPGWTDFLARHRKEGRHPSRGPMLNAVGPVDLVVLAGDIHNGLRGIVYAEQVGKYLDAPVVMVAGNHEYYHNDITTMLPAFMDTVQNTKHVHFLENQAASFTFSGQRLKLLGCTLWTDFALHGVPEQAMINAERIMNDYRYIELAEVPLLPWKTREFHAQSLAWLHAELGAAEPGVKRIVVTHHAPAAQVLGKRVGQVAPAYASDIIGQFEPSRLDLWVHGHTHFRHDSVIDGIRVVSAPRGYVGHDGSKALQFKPGILEL
jgi:predicted MPP superfamily phosphohydrolase